MMKFNKIKRLLSTVLSLSLIVSSVSVRVYADDINAGGWFESIYAQIPGIEDADVTEVSYSGTMSGTLSGEDLEYLVRDSAGGVRIDIPGLKEGTYTLNVKTASGSYEQKDIEVYAFDRTGYAHYDAHKAGINGVGAYKDDGTLKSGAKIVYVTEENKNTVQVPGFEGSSYPKGIGNILNYKSEDANGVTGGGKTDVIKELYSKGTPLVVRFVGSIRAGDENTLGSNAPSENILGLTAYNSTGNGGTTGDNGMVARIYKASNITFEGIGTDAVIDGWGFQVISQTGYVSNSIEFRNLTFINTAEDAIGLEGTASKSSSPQSKEWLDSGNSPIKYAWVHNNTFEKGYCYKPAESDKADGDGSVDFKRGYGYTLSYNHFVNNHKTNLIGSSSDSIQYDCTFNHNYYENVDSRQPLARQANIHILNSYFQGPENSYIISPRANSYIFSEGNFYENCKNPVDSAKEGKAAV
ncbi:MAG: polysaccharide lyase, partial [Firmicutes bacterium]|nr:polysaccharide lyase [Bacillota bacterium]